MSRLAPRQPYQVAVVGACHQQEILTRNLQWSQGSRNAVLASFFCEKKSVRLTYINKNVYLKEKPPKKLRFMNFSRIFASCFS